MITCEQCRDEMAEFALGHGDPEARVVMSAHLATCVVCRRELTEIESAWAALPLACPPAAPSSDLFDRIMTRIDGSTEARPSGAAPTAATPLTPRQRLYSYVLAASVLLAIVGGALMWGERPASSPTGDLVADQALRDLAQRLGKLQELEQMLNTGGVRLASLHARSTSDNAGAYVVWDTSARQWHFFVTDLKPAPAGKAYQLWAVVQGQKPLAGPTFTVNSAGTGSVVADFPDLNPGVKASAVVTLEPQVGSEIPSGKPVLEASL
jgi:anti-sigma-K factor RskA